MIPARIRSNSNWLVLFRLNPVDFENVYKDVVMVSGGVWEKILEAVYNISNEEGVYAKESAKDAKRSKTYNHLDIMVDYDIYFKNF